MGNSICNGPAALWHLQSVTPTDSFAGPLFCGWGPYTICMLWSP